MLRQSFFASLALAAVATTAQAQVPLTASIVVSGATFTTSATNQLNFPTTIAGTPVTVDASTSGASNVGMYTVSGASSIPLGTISVTFPTVLNCTAGGCTAGTDNLPFSAPSLAIAQSSGGARNACTGGTAPTLNCSAGAGSTSANRTPSGGSLFIFVGGTASPAAAQRPGTYTGTINATVAY